ncbi:hypothetical protein HA47_02875 [Pantoea stewartii subsp. indologenes]|uniref:ATP-dependent nuclease n=1 Tax=Pantoea stewartii TaxID=66269 RepID=UPI00051027DD|nr:ATP-dependent endonuclease [Pantoea stewartii]KGD85170.1 hypothetical protein HA47_02875 [Pantoea stewartii subsp. indologenes]
MNLEHIDIRGFRGINQLSLPLTRINLLIGENAWGKSSLLDALSLLLSPHTREYVFTSDDFHFTPGDRDDQVHRLSVVFHFREDEAETSGPLAPFWRGAIPGQRYLRYSIQARRHAGQIRSSRRFIDSEGQVLPEAGTAEAIDVLLRMNPVLRLRDARFSRRLRPVASRVDERLTTLNQLTQELDNLTRDLDRHPQQLSDAVLRQGVQTLQQLMEHQKIVQHPAHGSQAFRVDPQSRDGVEGWRSLDQLNHLIAATDVRSRQLILLRMFSLLMQARGNEPLLPGARPLLLIEDPETRLHPIMLSVAWNLLALLPLQKIATTNSGELLSQVAVEDVCRLVREPTRVAAWRIGPEGLSAEDSRRIGFHIRVNRPSALFARCWLLVEGETEVWIINQMARQCGYHFAAEGIKVIEYAQSGLKPLLKFARRMGIAWHVLTDGDMAGKKYAATARSQLQPHDNEKHHLTQLPAADMEQFLYNNGFSEVYHAAAHLPLNVPVNSRRIITKAIHRASKPELAITVAMAAAERGTASVPTCLQEMFVRVIQLAQGKAG